MMTTRSMLAWLLASCTMACATGCSAEHRDRESGENEGALTSATMASYGQGGIADLIDGDLGAHAMQTDGKLVLAGRYYTPARGPVARVVRLTRDGGLDATFGASGVATVDFDGALYGKHWQRVATAIAPSGAIYVVASTGGPSGQLEIARLKSDGSRDATFGTTGLKSHSDIPEITAAKVIDGKLVLVTTAPYQPLVRFLADGSLDTGFNDALASDMNGLEAHNYLRKPWVDVERASSGDLIVGGGGGGFWPWTFDGRFLRVQSDGHVVTSYGDALARTPYVPQTAPRFQVTAFTLDGDSAVGVGVLGDDDTKAVAFKLTADGDLDASFGTGGIAELNLAVDPTYDLQAPLPSRSWVAQRDGFYGVTLDASGRVLATGGSRGAPVVVRLRADGTRDVSFAAGDATRELQALRSTVTPHDEGSAREWATVWAGRGAYLRAGQLVIPLARGGISMTAAAIKL